MSENPWLNILADDYEGHMANNKVGQLQELNKIFKEVIEKYKPENLCVMGCTTGNGFEHINTAVTKKVIGIDLNNEYLQILKNRHGQRITNLDLICGDINEMNIDKISVDLIWAALIFEYIDWEKTLIKIVNLLKNNGRLVVVLQKQIERLSAVSETSFKSLQQLDSIFNYIEPKVFNEKAMNLGLFIDYDNEVTLPNGKIFYVGSFKK